MDDPIPVNEPLLDGREATYLRECIDSGWISSEGPFVARFEEAFSAMVCESTASRCATARPRSTPPWLRSESARATR